MTTSNQSEEDAAMEMLAGAIAGVVLVFLALAAWVWVGVV
jgi:hypothetical protein